MINDDKRVLEHFNNLLDRTKDKEKITVNRQNIVYLVNKLEKYFEQAERVEELEEENEQLEDDLNVMQNYYVHDLKVQNERYKKALEFYADEENYEPLNMEVGAMTKDGYKVAKYRSEPKIEMDKGQKARQALEGET